MTKALDMKEFAQQLRVQMAAAALADAKSFGELAADWLKRVVRVKLENEKRHVRHLATLAQLREGELTKATIEQCFAKLDKVNGGTLGPATLNKVRSTGKLVVDDATACGAWKGANPFDYVKFRRVPKKPWPRITAAELGAAIAQLREDRRREALVMIFMGLRPGELKALQKVDVDLKRGFVSVQRSNDRDQTKTGNCREVPIPDGCRPALEQAIAGSSSSLVFPRPDGTMQRADTKLSRTLRAAFKKAGLITGYRCTCRKCGAESELDAMPSEPPECSDCGVLLWCEPIPRRFTWYGLRHAASSLHREAGADALAVKSALGWIQRDVGDDVYTHLRDERFHAELNKLELPAPTASTPARTQPTSSDPARLHSSESARHGLHRCPRRAPVATFRTRLALLPR